MNLLSVNLKYGIFFTIVSLLGLAVGVCSAQEPSGRSLTGVIQGKVYDANTREPLVGANVVLLETAYGASTDQNGSFEIRNVPIGTYRAQATYLSHNTQVKTDIVVASGKYVDLTFAMEDAAIEGAEVVIEPDYFNSKPETAVSSQALSNEEIRRAPGGLEDVVRAIAVLPGVVQASAGRNDLIVRGGAPSENLYTIDHLEVPNINHFGTQGASGGPLSFVNLDYVEEVNFSTGGFGAKYGDKLSSSMNIALKDGRTDHLGGKATVSASQFGLNLEGPIGDHSSFLFSARRSYLDFFFKAAGFGFVPEYWDFLGKTTHHIDSHNEISFLMLGILDNVRFINNDADQRFSNSQVLGNSQQQYFNNISWRHLFKNGFVTSSLGRTYVNYDFLQSDSLLNPIFKSKSKEGETSLRSDVVLLPQKYFEISAGVQAKAVMLDGDLLLPDTLRTHFGDTLLAGHRTWEKRAFKSSGYAQISKLFASKLRLTLGGRLDYFDRIEHKTVIAPRAMVSYAFNPQTSINLSAGTYYQAPSYIWLTANASNHSLDYLRADQIVGGVEHLIRPDTKLRIEVYAKQYQDYPVSLTRPYLMLSNTGAGYGGVDEGYSSFGLDPLVSEGTGLSRGIEFLAQKKLSEIPCYGIVSITYSKTDFKALDKIKRAGLFDQRVIVNLSGGYRMNQKWEFSGKFRFGTGTPYTPFNSDGTQVVSTYNSKRLPVFHTLDLRVDRRWNFSKWNLVTYLDVQNVYARKNVSDYTWNEREQKVDKNTNALGVLPSIGISAEF
jgi:hypothetical protein